MQAAIRSVLRFAHRLGAYVFLPLLIAVSVYDIFGRRFANTGSTQLQELQWHLFFAAVLSGIGYAYLAGDHVRIDTVRRRLSPRSRARVELAGCLIALLPFSMLLMIDGGEQAWRAYESGERSAAALGLGQRWIIKSAIPLAGFLLLLSGLHAAMASFRVLRGQAETASSMPEQDADGPG